MALTFIASVRLGVSLQLSAAAMPEGNSVVLATVCTVALFYVGVHT